MRQKQLSKDVQKKCSEKLTFYRITAQYENLSSCSVKNLEKMCLQDFSLGKVPVLQHTTLLAKKRVSSLSYCSKFLTTIDKNLFLNASTEIFCSQGKGKGEFTSIITIDFALRNT